MTPVKSTCDCKNYSRCSKEGVKNLGGLGEKAKSANGNVPYSNSSGELCKGTVDIMFLITFSAQE